SVSMATPKAKVRTPSASSARTRPSRPRLARRPPALPFSRSWTICMPPTTPRSPCCSCWLATCTGCPRCCCSRCVTPSRPGPAAKALGELLGHPGAERVAVGAFAPADVAALLERLTVGLPDADVVAALMDRTGGNPLYTTELVRLISSEHWRRPLTADDVLALDVPSGIRDVLLRRVHRLPDDTQSLLIVAAVAGRELDPDLLEHVTALDAEHLLLN